MGTPPSEGGIYGASRGVLGVCEMGKLGLGGLKRSGNVFWFSHRVRNGVGDAKFSHAL